MSNRKQLNIKYILSLPLKLIYKLGLDKMRLNLIYRIKSGLNRGKKDLAYSHQGILRNLLFEIIDLMEANGIRYWIDHGTLLGCLRNQKFVPWDDDTDISCFSEDKEKVRNLLNSGTRYFQEIKNHFKVYHKLGTYSHVDIFFYKELIPEVLVMTYGYEQHMRKSDVRFLRKKKLYDRFVNVPDHADNYLSRKWGLTWETRQDRYRSGTGTEYYRSRKPLKRDFKESRLLAYSLHKENGKFTLERPQEIDCQMMDPKLIKKLGENYFFEMNGKYARHINKKIVWTDLARASHFILSEQNRLSIVKQANEFWPEHKISVVVPAAGSGDRINLETPKQFLEVDGKPIIYYAIKPFEESPRIQEIVIGAQEDMIGKVKEILLKFQFKKCRVIMGAESRRKTIHNCIKTIANKDFVILHDAVRPFVTKANIQELIRLAPYYDMVTFCTPIKGGLSKVWQGDLCEKAVRRDQYVVTHCPHIIAMEYIKRNPSYRYNISQNCKLIPTTSLSVFKITYPQDLQYFEAVTGQSDV